MIAEQAADIDISKKLIPNSLEFGHPHRRFDRDYIISGKDYVEAVTVGAEAIPLADDAGVLVRPAAVCAVEATPLIHADDDGGFSPIVEVTGYILGQEVFTEVVPDEGLNPEDFRTEIHDHAVETLMEEFHRMLGQEALVNS